METDVLRLARRQHGLISRQQALDAGMTRHQVQHRLDEKRWESVDYGVYCLVGTALTFHQRLLAPCLAGPAVASHRAAGELWQLPVPERGIVEVTALRWTRRRRTTAIWHESRFLDGDDITSLDAVPVTRATRTLIDLGSVLDELDFEAALDDALRRGLTSLESLRRHLNRLRRVHARETALERTAIERRGTRVRVPESALESRLLHVVQKSGFSSPEAQFVINDDRRFVARVDFAWPAARVALEAQSLQFHAGRQSLERDVERRNELESLGWRVFEATARNVDNPARLIELLTRALVRT